MPPLAPVTSATFPSSSATRAVQLGEEIGHGVDDARGPVRVALGLALLGHARQNEDRLQARLEPATTSVSMRSPIIAVVSECASIALSAERIISGFGLPT